MGRKVRDEDEDEDAKEDGQETFDEEDPAPPGEPGFAV